MRTYLPNKTVLFRRINVARNSDRVIVNVIIRPTRSGGSVTRCFRGRTIHWLVGWRVFIGNRLQKYSVIVKNESSKIATLITLSTPYRIDWRQTVGASTRRSRRNHHKWRKFVEPWIGSAQPFRLHFVHIGLKTWCWWNHKFFQQTKILKWYCPERKV